MDDAGYKSDQPSPWADALEGVSLIAAAMGLIGACCVTGPLAIGCLGGAAAVFYLGYSGADIIRDRESIPVSPATPEAHQEPASLLETVSYLYEQRPELPSQAKRWVETTRPTVAEVVERSR